MTQLSPFLTADQVAEHFLVTPETAREWARSGKVPAIKLPGGQYRFKREVIEAMENVPAAEVAA